MSDQYEMFSGEAYARGSDPGTSHAAAESVRGEDATRMEIKVLNAIRSSPQGMTNHEIVESTGLTWNTASPRVRPLVRKGWIADSGERRVGPTNRKCIVWKAT